MIFELHIVGRMVACRTFPLDKPSFMVPRCFHLASLLSPPSRNNKFAGWHVVMKKEAGGKGGQLSDGIWDAWKRMDTQHVGLITRFVSSPSDGSATSRLRCFPCPWTSATWISAMIFFLVSSVLGFGGRWCYQAALIRNPPSPKYHFAAASFSLRTAISAHLPHYKYQHHKTEYTLPSSHSPRGSKHGPTCVFQRRRTTRFPRLFCVACRSYHPVPSEYTRIPCRWQSVQVRYLYLSLSTTLQQITFPSTFPACHSSKHQIPGLELTDTDDTAAHQFPRRIFPIGAAHGTCHHFTM